MLKLLKSKRGEGYIDVCVLVLCAVLVIALAVKVFPVFIAKNQLVHHIYKGDLKIRLVDKKLAALIFVLQVSVAGVSIVFSLTSGMCSSFPSSTAFSAYYFS